MSNKEMAELFALMMMVWPNAELFRGGTQKLTPTIKFWASCTPEVDSWVGQQAVTRLCQTSRFPPTIAEFKAAAAEINAEIKRRIDAVWDYISLALAEGQSPAQIVRCFPPGSLCAKAFDAIGKASPLSYQSFSGAYRAVIQTNNIRLPESRDALLRIPAGTI